MDSRLYLLAPSMLYTRRLRLVNAGFFSLKGPNLLCTSTGSVICYVQCAPSKRSASTGLGRPFPSPLPALPYLPGVPGATGAATAHGRSLGASGRPQ